MHDPRRFFGHSHLSVRDLGFGGPTNSPCDLRIRLFPYSPEAEGLGGVAGSWGRLAALW